MTLLYTGNHYGIIHLRAPSAECSHQRAFLGEHPADYGSVLKLSLTTAYE